MKSNIPNNIYANSNYMHSITLNVEKFRFITHRKSNISLHFPITDDISSVQRSTADLCRRRNPHTCTHAYANLIVLKCCTDQKILWFIINFVPFTRSPFHKCAGIPFLSCRANYHSATHFYWISVRDALLQCHYRAIWLRQIRLIYGHLWPTVKHTLVRFKGRHGCSTGTSAQNCSITDLHVKLHIRRARNDDDLRKF